MTAQNPLIVELESLICSDLNWEGYLFSIRQGIQRISRSFCNKKESANLHGIETLVTHLPYRRHVLQLIEKAKQQGQKIILLVNKNLDLAQEIASHLDCFDQVLDAKNYSAQQLQEQLLTLYNEKGFNFIGCTDKNIILCSLAAEVYFVYINKKTLSYIKTLHNIQLIRQENISFIKDWLYELRLHQWIKNILIFVPLLTSHHFNLYSIAYGILAFLLFSLCSSSVYLLNDLLDLQDDRQHNLKCHRPFASGRLPIQIGLIICPLLLFTSLISAISFLSFDFFITIVFYYSLTLAYSLFFKRCMAIDVVVLATLYSLRIIAGAVALEVDLTSWILAFSMFIFLSLALVKRYTELNDSKQEGGNVKIAGRGYYPDDLGMIASLGAAAGYLSVMVLALYINSPQTAVMYSNPEFIWLSCPLLLFWVTRIWLLAHRGQLHSDPVVFAIRDKVSLLTGALFVFVFGVAL